jgi:hypothetical protein
VRNEGWRLADPKSGKEAFARLRRAVETTDPEVEALVELIGPALFDLLPEAQVLMLERTIVQFAQAAEELGADASPDDIRRRAHELAARPT